MEFQLFRTVAILGSLVLTAFVLELIRRRKLTDELWLPWLFLSLAPLAAGAWIAPWAAIARGLGIRYEPSLLFGLAILLFLAMLLYLAVVVSTLTRQNTRLAQEIAILRLRLDR